MTHTQLRTDLLDSAGFRDARGSAELAPISASIDERDAFVPPRTDALTADDWRFLAESGVALGQAEELADALRIGLRVVVPQLADFAIIWLAQPYASDAMLRAAYARPELSTSFAFSAATQPIVLSAEHPARRVQRTGRLEWGSVDATRLSAIARDADHLARLRALAPRSVIHVPLRERGRILGSLLLGRASGESPAYRDSDVAVASELALRLAITVARTEERDAYRNAFRERAASMATTSHDLKDPLALIETAMAFAVDSMNDWNEKGGDTAAMVAIVARQLVIARRAAERTRELVIHTLDALRNGATVAGDARGESCSPATTLRELAEEMSVLARARDILLAVDVAPELPPIGMSATDLGRAVGNVLGNAVKFTPAGGRVMLRASAAEDAVQISIADTGRGIRAADLPHVFRPFWRAVRKPGAQADDASGSGLGLAIARDLVHRAGGTIWCRSTYGAGATFRIRLPRSG